MKYKLIKTKYARAMEKIENDLFDNAFSANTLRNEIKAGGGYVALDDKHNLVGYALTRFDEGLTDLTKLAVKKEYQGQGVGTYLLKLVIDNAEKVMLCVNKTNKRAITLYKRHGFQVTGSIFDSWLMERKAYMMRKV